MFANRRMINAKGLVNTPSTSTITMIGLMHLEPGD